MATEDPIISAICRFTNKMDMVSMRCVQMVGWPDWPKRWDRLHPSFKRYPSSWTISPTMLHLQTSLACSLTLLDLSSRKR